MHLQAFWMCQGYGFLGRLSRAFKEGRVVDTKTMPRFTEGDVDRTARAELGDRAVSGASRNGA